MVVILRMLVFVVVIATLVKAGLLLAVGGLSYQDRLAAAAAGLGPLGPGLQAVMQPDPVARWLAAQLDGLLP